MTVTATDVCTCSDPAAKSCPACLAYEQAERAQRRNERIARSGLPRKLRTAALLTYTAELTDAATRWAKGETTGLCLTGPVGVGKTCLAAWAAEKRLQNYAVRWVSVSRLMTQLRSGFGSEMKARADQIVAGTGAIVLDDLDKVNPTDYGREVILAAIEGRYQAGSSLLVTTNRELSELKEMLGAPVASRLAEYCEVLRMVGEDRRLG
jgi:DNA replication protein DnaC